MVVSFKTNEERRKRNKRRDFVLIFKTSEEKQNKILYKRGDYYEKNKILLFEAIKERNEGNRDVKISRFRSEEGEELIITEDDKLLFKTKDLVCYQKQRQRRNSYNKGNITF